MSKSLGMISTAEGVETLDQLQPLRKEVAEFQGYYAGRPCSYADATAMLEVPQKAVVSA